MENNQLSPIQKLFVDESDPKISWETHYDEQISKISEAINQLNKYNSKKIKRIELKYARYFNSFIGEMEDTSILINIDIIE